MPQGVSDVSGALRAARERAGMSLEELSARTRIKLAFLQAIEIGRFEDLPGEFFTRAFLRTYARELHLPADEIVREFDASRRPPDPSPELESAPNIVAAPGTDRTLLEDDAAWPASGRGFVPVAVMALIAVATIYVWARPAPGRANEPAAVGTIGTSGAGGEVEAQPATAARPEGPRAEPEYLSIEIQTSGTTWIAATADGQRVAYRLFEGGDKLTLRARDELSFRLGNAGAFGYSINGTPGKPVGGPGDVREFKITRENYRGLLVAGEQ